MHTQLHLMLVQEAQAETRRRRPAERSGRASRRNIRGRLRARAAAPGLPPRAAPGI